MSNAVTWIDANKQWVFGGGGIGVVCITILANLFTKSTASGKHSSQTPNDNNGSSKSELENVSDLRIGRRNNTILLGAAASHSPSVNDNRSHDRDHHPTEHHHDGENHNDSIQGSERINDDYPQEETEHGQHDHAPHDEVNFDESNNTDEPDFDNHEYNDEQYDYDGETYSDDELHY